MIPNQLSRREALRVGLAALDLFHYPISFGFAPSIRRLRMIMPSSLFGSEGDAATSTPTTPNLIRQRNFAAHFSRSRPRRRACSSPNCFLCKRRFADRFTLLRSMVQTGPGHPAGSLQLLSGDPDRADKLVPTRPDLMSVASYLRPAAGQGLPSYVGVNPIRAYDNFTIAGPAYLGPGYAPFAVLGDPSLPTFRVPNVGIADAAMERSLRDRRDLQRAFDLIKRNIDRAGVMDAVDRFESQALDLLLSPVARRAFDLTEEDPRLRERYGMHAWGQQCLMARRLVEAGVSIVTTTFDGPLCGRVSNWDDHAVNHHVFDALRFRAPYFDQAVSALIEDVYARGLDQKVLVVVTGEFGRTPRISYVASSGSGVASAAAGTVQPGRDHWPDANSMIWAGGGIATGQVIGATDRRGEQVIHRRVGPQDFLATIYQHLGIDYKHTTIPDPTGRPIPIVEGGEAIAELLAGSKKTI